MIAAALGNSAAERTERHARPSTFPRPRTSGRIVRLADYDVRIRRELAHRRFVISLLRQALRLISLHVLDAVTICAAYFMSNAIAPHADALRPLPGLIGFTLVGLHVAGSYRSGPLRRDSERLMGGTLIAVVLIALAETFLPAPVLSSSFIAIFGLASICALLVERAGVDAVVRQFYARGYGLRRALVLALGHENDALMDALMPSPSVRGSEDHVVVGFVTPDRRPDPSALGSMDDLYRILEDRDVTELLIATKLREDTLNQVAEQCFERGVRVLFMSPVPNTLGCWAEPTRVGLWPAYQLHPARLELPALMLKRASDLVLATIAVLIGAPLMALIAIAIKMETRGPVFFRQRRVGLGGREFMIWKFRSMSDEAESKQHEVEHLNHYPDERLFKLPMDPRITRVGRFLRRFSLDELPQLFNIIVGNMSVVGPRPPLPREVKQYEKRHYIRLSVVPGLTGPWQVNGRNLITDFEQVVRLEREYIEGWSLRSDAEIIVRTIGVVLSGKGAY